MIGADKVKILGFTAVHLDVSGDNKPVNHIILELLRIRPGQRPLQRSSRMAPNPLISFLTGNSPKWVQSVWVFENYQISTLPVSPFFST